MALRASFWSPEVLFPQPPAPEIGFVSPNTSPSNPLVGEKPSNPLVGEKQDGHRHVSIAQARNWVRSARTNSAGFKSFPHFHVARPLQAEDRERLRDIIVLDLMMRVLVFIHSGPRQKTGTVLDVARDPVSPNAAFFEIPAVQPPDPGF